MQPDEESGDETPAQLEERAAGLRECATQARSLAETFGPLVDTEAEKAQQRDPAIWEGPYADTTTQLLSDNKTTLNSMASALLHDASRWETEADELEERAGQLAEDGD